MTAPSVSLRRLAALLWSRRLTLAAVVLVAALISAYYSLTLRVAYESSALLAQVKDDSSQLGGAISSVVGQLGGLVGGLGLPGGATSVEESVAVLRSRDFALRFMNEHGVLPYLFPKLWDQAAGKWRPDAVSGGSTWATQLAQRLSGQQIVVPPVVAGPLPDDEVRAFDNLRAADIDRRTNFVRLAVRGPSPQIAQAWANEMIHDLNESLRQRALDDSRRAIKLLEQKVDSEAPQSERVIASALLESQLRHEVSAESRREYALRVIDPPSLPYERYAPRRARIVMFGAALGFLTAAAYVVLLAAWRQRRRAVPSARSAG